MSTREFESVYRSFEDRFRGSSEVIRERQRVYLPLIEAVAASAPAGRRALDIGCGRGEWLGLIARHGWTGIGVDSNQSMLSPEAPAGVVFVHGDGLDYLRSCADRSFSLATAFHVVEHVSSDVLAALLKELRRVLSPGGIVILETPNPENLTVASWSFYMDPTHKAPIAPALLQYCAEAAGFTNAAVFRLNGAAGDRTNPPLSRLAGLFANAPDYSVIALNGEAEGTSLGENIARFVDQASEPSPADLPELLREIDTLMQRAGSVDRIDHDVKAATERLAGLEAAYQTMQHDQAGLRHADAGLQAELLEVDTRLQGALRQAQTRLQAELRQADMRQQAELRQTFAKLQSELLQTDTRLQSELRQTDARLRAELLNADTRLKAELSDVDSRLQAELLQADARVQAELRIVKTESEAPPLDRAARAAKRIGLGVRAWATLRPGSRPRRMARSLIVKGYLAALERPALLSAFKRLTRAVPPLDRRVRHLLQGTPMVAGLTVDPPSASLPTHLACYAERLASGRLRQARRSASRSPVGERSGGRKPRLAYVSPLPPERTGIADYSAALLPALGAHYEIDVVCDQVRVEHPWIEQNCGIRDPAWFRDNAAGYDRIVYHIGNSIFHSFMLPLLADIPGVVVLHDFFLSHVLADMELQYGWGFYWTTALYHSHGYPAVATRWKPDGIRTAIDTYPANFAVLDQAQGIITHSHYPKTLCAAFYPAFPTSRWEVIPLVREPAPEDRREAARRAVGTGPVEFLVCSFGFVQETKLNHLLVEAWARSPLAQDRRCRLVFVGAVSGDAYGQAFRERIADPALGGRVSVSGYASAALYATYLQAADLGVQLRSLSRGETSAAVLDCLSHGVPTIINANGSLAELPGDCVFRLEDGVDAEALRDALTGLFRDETARARIGEAGRRYVAEHHAPAPAAELYRSAFEAFAASAPRIHDHRRILPAIEASPVIGAAPDAPADIQAILAEARPDRPQRQILVDVSALVREDLRTGIQRVVRSQLSELLKAPPQGYRIEPVWLKQDRDVWRYHYARHYTLRQFGISPDVLPEEPVDVGEGDIFFGADFFPQGVITAQECGIYEEWRRRGVRIGFAVYDLLPLTMPHNFPPVSEQVHERWLRAVAPVADTLVCISRSVADDVRRWLSTNGLTGPSVRDCVLGADIEASEPSKGLPADAAATLGRIADRDSFLMVGTIEPRKGHLQVLAAFDRLWAEGADVQLVIVGGIGWTGVPAADARTLPTIVERLRNHPALGGNLIWLERASDEYLALIYRLAGCLVAASEGEGYGLPLVEAARYGLPVVARDIPVFREVGGDRVAYFTGPDGEALAAALRSWRRERGDRRAHSSARIDVPTWSQNVARLTTILLDPSPGEPALPPS